MRQCVCGKSKIYPYCDNSHIRPKEDKNNDQKDQNNNLQD
jgi:CDGSH-type Zn-finger protein